MWDMFKGTVIHLKTEISVKGVLLSLAGVTFISIYGMDQEKLQNLKPFVDFGAQVVALLSGSVVIVLKLSSISSLKRLWQSYKGGSLKEKLKKSLNEEEELKELSQGEEIDVEVTIDEEEYHAVLWNLILLNVKGKSMKNDKSQRRHSVCCERDVSEDRSKTVVVKGKPMKDARIKRRHSVCCERDIPEDIDVKEINRIAARWAAFKKEKEIARQCRLLIDGGTRALRDVFDSIHSPSSLHSTLLSTKILSTLKGLRAEKNLSEQQWDRLYPASRSKAVTSADFDITLLFVLLRNICGLTPPPTGWDKPPAATDLSREADLARVKYYRNELYEHITETAVSDCDFEKYWSEISDVLVRLGGPHYKPEIERFKIEAMDPEDEKYFIGALKEWEEMELKLKLLPKRAKRDSAEGKTMRDTKSQHRDSVCYERDAPEDSSKPMDVQVKETLLLLSCRLFFCLLIVNNIHEALDSELPMPQKDEEFKKPWESSELLDLITSSDNSKDHRERIRKMKLKLKNDYYEKKAIELNRIRVIQEKLNGNLHFLRSITCCQQQGTRV
ncbi:uncharacterized protein LOC116307458 [Actinia tenebrosa]|uniref:Uncharacterized protein LOC116307458 n=1 Tax=Actinia tenebrosa TaxID=6105 RepID=A0A6P8J217_ACTTE|nr:uncharacterized protein LOC116307458 [Actinia tenebrosa]